MGVKYGCPVEDIITGLSIQCRGWKSAYLTPKKKAFLGVAPTNLHQMLGQQRRDGQRPCSCGAEERANDVALQKDKLVSVRFMDTIMKKLGVSESAFAITAKVAEEEAAEKEVMEFGVESPMFLLLGTLGMLYLFCFASAIMRRLRLWRRFSDNGFAVWDNMSTCGTKLTFVRGDVVTERQRDDANERDIHVSISCSPSGRANHDGFTVLGDAEMISFVQANPKPSLAS
ncbi:hypothetical protein YC2023_076142 [Brassica napus]